MGYNYVVLSKWKLDTFWRDRVGSNGEAPWGREKGAAEWEGFTEMGGERECADGLSWDAHTGRHGANFGSDIPFICYLKWVGTQI